MTPVRFGTRHPNNQPQLVTKKRESPSWAYSLDFFGICVLLQHFLNFHSIYRSTLILSPPTATPIASRNGAKLPSAHNEMPNVQHDQYMALSKVEI